MIRILLREHKQAVNRVHCQLRIPSMLFSKLGPIAANLADNKLIKRINGVGAHVSANRMLSCADRRLPERVPLIGLLIETIIYSPCHQTRHDSTYARRDSTALVISRGCGSRCFHWLCTVRKISCFYCRKERPQPDCQVQEQDN